MSARSFYDVRRLAVGADQALREAVAEIDRLQAQLAEPAVTTDSGFLIYTRGDTYLPGYCRRVHEERVRLACLVGRLEEELERQTQRALRRSKIGGAA